MGNKKPRYVHVYLSRGSTFIYFRRGKQNIRLRGPIYSAAFFDDYAAAIADKHKSPSVAGAKAKHGSFQQLIARYYSSAHFTALEESTRRTYRSQLEHFRTEYGELSVATIKVQHIDKILGRIAAKSTAQADKFYDRLKMLFKLAHKWEFRDDNPMHHVDRPKHKSIGYADWSDDDIGTFRAHWKDGTPQRVAFEVLLNTGLRRSDAVRLGRQHRHGDWHKIKTKKVKGTEVNVPVTPDLERHLSFCRKDSLTYITTVYGASRSEKAFTNWIREAAQAAGLPKNRSPHGLRKAACRRLAEAGCSAMEIMAITGHKNIKEIHTYVAQANQQKLALAATGKLTVSLNVVETKIG